MTKILLVEDDKDLREIYSVRLLAEGYTLISSDNGEEALAAAVGEKPDLIISDVMMPKISGFEMLDLLKSNDSTKNIPVIMLTALSSDNQRDRGSNLGADRYLVKSQVGLEDIIRTVHEVLNDWPQNESPNNGSSSAPGAVPSGALANEPIAAVTSSNSTDTASDAINYSQMTDPAVVRSDTAAQAQNQLQSTKTEPILNNPSITGTNFKQDASENPFDALNSINASASSASHLADANTSANGSSPATLNTSAPSDLPSTASNAATTSHSPFGPAGGPAIASPAAIADPTSQQQRPVEQQTPAQFQQAQRPSQTAQAPTGSIATPQAQAQQPMTSSNQSIASATPPSMPAGANINRQVIQPPSPTERRSPRINIDELLASASELGGTAFPNNR